MSLDFHLHYTRSATKGNYYTPAPRFNTAIISNIISTKEERFGIIFSKLLNHCYVPI